MGTGVIRIAVSAGIALACLGMASPALAADDPSLMPPGYVGGGATNTVPPAPAAPTPLPEPSCTVPHPVQGCDVYHGDPASALVPQAPAPVYVTPAPTYVAPQPVFQAPAPVYVAPAAPAPSYQGPAASSPDNIGPVQAPAPVISNGQAAALEGEASLTLTPAGEPAADAVAAEVQENSSEAISSIPSTSAAPSPSSSPKSDVVIKASTVSNDEGFNAMPILIFSILGLAGLAGFAGFQKWRSKRL